MAFGRKTDSGTASPRVMGEASLSIIGPGMTVVGDLMTEGTIRIEGHIQGTVRASKAVVIHKDGSVEGDIVTQDAVIGGRVRGTVMAESRLELQSTCDIEGQIRAPVQHLQLEEGARFNGQIQMLDETQVRALPATHQSYPESVAGD
jgi:cytoskeletal protein CcmA (bactofilin family)